MTSKQIEARMYQMLSLAVKRGSAAGLCSTPIGERILVIKNVAIPTKEAQGAVCGTYSITPDGKWRVRGKECLPPYPVAVEK